MTDQERALRLADELQEISKNPWAKYWERCLEAAAELRRLHALNGELLEALKAMLENGQDYTATRDKARAAIAKAEGEQT